jgi:single-strand DNA-binding protein
MATFSLATSFTWKDRDGADQEKTEWHRIVAWGRLGEICGEYLSKGKQVYIEGRIQSRDWEDQDGNRRTTFEIIANDMIMLGGGGGGGGSGGGGGPYRDRPPRRESDGYGNHGRQEEGGQATRRGPRDDREYEPPPPEDDIPF